MIDLSFFNIVGFGIIIFFLYMFSDVDEYDHCEQCEEEQSKIKKDERIQKLEDKIKLLEKKKR